MDHKSRSVYAERDFFYAHIMLNISWLYRVFECRKLPA